MNLIINQIILHILDTNIDTPVLSDNLLSPDDSVRDFLKSHILNSFESDTTKDCSFSADSAFCIMLEESNGDFIAFSKKLAQRFFELMKKHPDIADGDLIVADLIADETPYLGVFKLNYKTSFIHHYTRNENTNNNSIINQRTVLPSAGGKVDEFFFVNMSNSDIRLCEKKYEINEAKDYYISSMILECSTQSKSQKDKLSTVKKAAEKALKTHYTDDKMINAAVSSIIADETCDNILEVEKVKEKVAREYPLAKETFAQQIEEKQMDDEKIYVAPSSAKRLEKQSIKTKNGVVINIPTYLMNEENVEFINNPNGTISILIKNVHMY